MYCYHIPHTPKRQFLQYAIFNYSEKYDKMNEHSVNENYSIT